MKNEEGWIVKILDILRKLGIIRFGATAKVYRNAAERPVEFMMDDVFDAEKDLITRSPDQAPVYGEKKSVKSRRSSYQSQELD
jgi:hypothetical protein